MLWLTRPDMSSRIAGGLLFTGGAATLMGIITAEALYPARYGAARNVISDLGGSRPPNSVILQPSATIFDFTMVGVGVLVIGGAYFLRTARWGLATTIPVGLLGVGMLGLGIFPGNSDLHPLRQEHGNSP